jgi:hypothetical protein
LLLALPIRLWAQVAPRFALSPVVRVAVQIDSTAGAQFEARGFELKLSPSGAAGAPTEIQLVKQAGVHTGTLMSLTANGVHATSAIIEVLDSLAKPAITFRLSDVTILSDHLSLSASRANLEQQRISQQEALSSLTTDLQEAQRQLATAEEMNKTRGATRLELARAHDRVADLQRRLDLVKQRQALVASQLADQGPLDETIVLHFGRIEVDNREVGGRTAIDLVGRPRGKS